jgi:hypothetical protein
MFASAFLCGCRQCTQATLPAVVPGDAYPAIAAYAVISCSHSSLPGCSPAPLPLRYSPAGSEPGGSGDWASDWGNTALRIMAAMPPVEMPEEKTFLIRAGLSAKISGT